MGVQKSVVVKVCKGLLARNKKIVQDPAHTQFWLGYLQGGKVVLEKVIWMLECEYPDELYEKYPEYLDDAVEGESQDEDKA